MMSGQESSTTRKSFSGINLLLGQRLGPRLGEGALSLLDIHACKHHLSFSCLLLPRLHGGGESKESGGEKDKVGSRRERRNIEQTNPAADIVDPCSLRELQS